jgi:AraC-like DNA-binding protein
MEQENGYLYRQFSPAGPLTPYVACYWMLKAPAPLSLGQERLPADGHTEIMFHLADPSKKYRADGNGEPHVQRASAILGARSRGYIIEQLGASHYVAIRFRPGGLAPFVNIPLTDLVDQTIDLDLLWGHVVHRLEEQLFDAASAENIVEILNQTLLERLEDRSHLHVIQAAVRMIDASSSNLSIRDLANHFGWSQKHFERIFTQYVGFVPKRYARISRFQQLSIWAARHSRDRNMGQLAADLGYYDQSHFIKEVTVLTGAPPSVFLSDANRIVQIMYSQPLPTDPSVEFLQDRDIPSHVSLL